MTTVAFKLINTAAQPATRRAARRGDLLSQRLELAVVLALMGSSAAYGLSALLHLV